MSQPPNLMNDQNIMHHPTLSDSELVSLTLDQVRAAKYLCRTISRVLHDSRESFAKSPARCGIALHRHAILLEALGEFLNAADAVDEDEGSWVDPILEASAEAIATPVTEGGPQ